MRQWWLIQEVVQVGIVLNAVGTPWYHDHLLNLLIYLVHLSRSSFYAYSPESEMTISAPGVPSGLEPYDSIFLAKSQEDCNRYKLLTSYIYWDALWYNYSAEPIFDAVTMDTFHNLSFPSLLHFNSSPGKFHRDGHDGPVSNSNKVIQLYNYET